jgi:hypothetical protein
MFPNFNTGWCVLFNEVHIIVYSIPEKVHFIASCKAGFVINPYGQTPESTNIVKILPHYISTISLKQVTGYMQQSMDFIMEQHGCNANYLTISSASILHQISAKSVLNLAADTMSL